MSVAQNIASLENRTEFRLWADIQESVGKSARFWPSRYRRYFWAHSLDQGERMDFAKFLIVNSVPLRLFYVWCDWRGYAAFGSPERADFERLFSILIPGGFVGFSWNVRRQRYEYLDGGSIEADPSPTHQNWSDIQDVIGPAEKWPAKIRSFFWRDHLGHWERLELASFTWVNGLNPEVLFDFFDSRCHMCRGSSEQRHLRDLFRYFEQGRRYRLWAFNVYNGRYEWLDGSRRLPGQVSYCV